MAKINPKKFIYFFTLQLSESLDLAFGLGTDGGKWTVDFILNKIAVNVRSFYAEEQVVNASLDIFLSLAKNKIK